MPKITPGTKVSGVVLHMEGSMKILNLHGFLGKADNKNYNALAGLFPDREIISPKLDYIHSSPEDILEELGKIAEKESDIIFVGQSLGGWFADKLSRKFSAPCVLTNPCYRPHELGIISESGMPEKFLWQYRFLSEDSRNELAYALISENDDLLPGNISNAEKYTRSAKRVSGSHSTIDSLKECLADTFAEIENDSLLRFFGRGSAFADQHNSAFFISGRDLVMIDCPATAFQKVKNMDVLGFDNIYVLVTHTHGDHSGGIGTMLQFVWFVAQHNGMTKRLTVVAPSEKVRKDLEYVLETAEGCNKEWFRLITTDQLHEEWFAAAIPTKHTNTLKNKCFGYQLRIKGKNVVYTGDTRIFAHFESLLTEGSFLYTEASSIETKVHLHLDKYMKRFTRLADNGVNVYLMHLDNEDEIREKIKGKKLKLVQLYP